ncbi:hypothetical protein ACFQ5M_07565 [Agrilactobacillus yilanensis]|uniref:Uncharacterized protein n=1 Tax=Agrilactobacillus yilanensis TaxID=2485997 RepID=A0ABW4JAK8_9LACO|nr:hypothetical protein [Agrilactobacillus yilanensis]
MDRIEAELKALMAEEPDYAQRAFYQALIDLLQVQTQRIELAAAEVDGRTWNHEQW